MSPHLFGRSPVALILTAAAILTVALSGLPARTQTVESGKPFFSPIGLDETAWDGSTSAGSDFFQHVNGAWLARTPIPADRPGVSISYMTNLRVQEQLHDLMEGFAKNTSTQPVGIEGKIGAFYAAFMDEDAIERLEWRPISRELNLINRARTHSDIARLMGSTVDDLYGSVFQPSIDVDFKDTQHYVVYIDQAGLGLPDRDYYLAADFAPKLAKYQSYVERLLSLVAWPDAAKAAEEIVALESRIARASWTKAEMRDPTTQYNPMTPAALQIYAPGFDWSAFLTGAKLASKGRVIVDQKTAFPALSAAFANARVDTLKAWLAFNVIDNAAPYLSASFQQVFFEFRGHELSGQTEQPVRWKRAVTAVSGPDCIYTARACFGTLDWAVGQAYTARYFTPETKSQVDGMVAELLTAFRARIRTLNWMSPATKAEAIKKLDTYSIKIGYPDHPRDYSSVVIRKDDLIGNVLRAARADWAFHVMQSNGAVDRSEWFMTPQTTDAYNGSLRDIVFPAAILQPPEFDPAADAAVNFGALGSIIGHEMTHGFDDQGRHIDAAGTLRDWWTADDARAFEARAATLGAQYAKYEPVQGAHINPDLTMGENIADLGGLEIALDAYHASLKGQPSPTLSGLTGDQRFFLAYAQNWRGKTREDAIRQQIASDPHSYRKFRVNGVVRNLDAWYPAFDVQSSQELYLSPEERARIW